MAPSWPLSYPYLVPIRSLPGQTWSVWSQEGPSGTLFCIYMVPMVTLTIYACSLHDLYLGPVLSGPYMVPTWSLPFLFLGPTWTLSGLDGEDGANRGPYVVFMLSLRFPSMFC